MNADRLFGLSVSPFGELNAISIQDLATWQGLLAAVCVAIVAAFAYWRRAPHLIEPRIGSAAGHNARGLFSRLTDSSLLCMLALAGYAVCRAFGRSPILLLVLALLGLLMLVIRAVVYLLLRGNARTPRMSMAERFGGWAIWFVGVLLMFQWLSPAISAVDAIAFPVAGARISLLDVMRVIFVLLLFCIAAIWLGAVIERRILLVQGLPIGMRVGIGKVTRVFLVAMAILLALTSVGVDLTALTVIGGAVGVGLGFGLQRIASNFISGFVLLGDRSIRPGDVITIGTRFGVVRELRARYVVVRDRDGVDTLIPNENIITSEVINWSYGDRCIRLKLPVRVSYQDNPRSAMQIMEDAAGKHPRVESEPAPAARLMGFSDSGIELELRFWIRDPEDGVNNVRSDLFLEIWDAFAAAGITIPYPQRVVHLRDPG